MYFPMQPAAGLLPRYSSDVTLRLQAVYSQA